MRRGRNVRNRRRSVRFPPRIAKDIRILFSSFGEKNVFVDRQGKWFLITNYALRSQRYEFNINPVYLLGFWPRDYGERRGVGAGIEHFYTDKDLRIRPKGSRRNWRKIPNTHEGMDPAGLTATRKEHMWVCCHLEWDPDEDDIRTSLAAVQLALTDPQAFT